MDKIDEDSVKSEEYLGIESIQDKPTSDALKTDSGIQADHFNNSSPVSETRYSRTMSPPVRLDAGIALMAVEMKYLSNMAEVDNWEHDAEVAAVNFEIYFETPESILVGTGIGGSSRHTNEFKPMKKKQTMDS